MNILRAEQILNTYPNPRGTRLADVYDDDDQVRDAVNTLFLAFEYPDYSHKTLSELLAQYNKAKLPVERGDSVFVRFAMGRAFRQLILGDLQEYMYSIQSIGEDLLIEYCSGHEAEAVRKRLNNQVHMQVLSREEALQWVQSGEAPSL